MSYILKTVRVMRPAISRAQLLQLKCYSQFLVKNFQNRLPLAIHCNQPFNYYENRIEFHSVAANKPKQYVAKTDRLPKILTKLSSNSVSIPFEQITTIRQKALRSYGIPIDTGFKILKSCSQLVDHSSDVRLKLVNDVWSQLLPMLKQPNKQHLIQLLQAYRRCERKSLDDYHKLVQTFGCTVDMEIYEELMYLSCQNDDSMENAEKLLHEMQAENLKPTERIYSAMILGYAKQGVDASENVLKTMQENNLPPTSHTYTALIKSYLINDCPEKALDNLKKCAEFSEDQLFDIIRYAAKKDGNDNVVIEALKQLPLIVRNAKQIDVGLQNLCIELVRLNRNRLPEKRIDPYNVIIRHLPVPVFENENSAEYGTFLLKEMISANESTANILELCENLIKSNRNTRPIHFCCVIALAHQLPVANDFLKALAAKEPLRPHYVRPLIVCAKNENEVIDTIEFASKLNVSLDTFTLLHYVLPRIPQTLSISQAGIKLLQDKGVRMVELKSAAIAHLLNENRPSEAYEIAKLSTASIDPAILSTALTEYVRRNRTEFEKNRRTIANLVKKLQASSCKDKYDFAGRWIFSIANSREILNGFPLTTQILNDYKDAGVTISKNYADLVLGKMYKTRGLHSQLSPIVNGLINKEMFPELKENEKLATGEAKIDKLEKDLAELKRNGFPVQGVLCRLFIACVKENKLDRAIEVRKLCDENNVADTPPMISQSVKLWTSVEDADKALQALHELSKRFPKFPIDGYKIVDLAALLVAKDRLDEAKQIIRQFARSNNKTNVNYMTNNIWRLLSAVCEHASKNGTAENQTEQLLNDLVKDGYCKYSSPFLALVIKEHMNKMDIHGAVAAFERFANEYNETPQMVMLLTNLIKISNIADEASHPLGYEITKQQAIDYLQRVIDTSLTVHDPEKANVNVVLAFASAGSEQQLRRILMNPAVKLDEYNLKKSLDYLKDHINIDAVVTLARCARGLQHEILNEENLFGMLLTHFSQTNDYQSALDFYERFNQDGDLKLSPKFGKALADLLMKNDQKLPDKLQIYIT